MSDASYESSFFLNYLTLLYDSDQPMWLLMCYANIHGSSVLFLHMLRSEIRRGMRAKFRTVAASNNRDHARNLSYYCLLALHICMVLFFTHIPFVANHTINATPPERLQQYKVKYQKNLRNYKSLGNIESPFFKQTLLNSNRCSSSVRSFSIRLCVLLITIAFEQVKFFWSMSGKRLAAL